MQKMQIVTLLIKDNIFGLVEEICKWNQVTVIGQRVLKNVIQVNKNTDMN